MATKDPATGKVPAQAGAGEQQEYKIRITLTSRNVKSLEKVCADLIQKAKEEEIRVKGPVQKRGIVFKCVFTNVLLIYIQNRKLLNRSHPLVSNQV
ncbi:unnamed protein product [Adineta ricciae]|uniref:Small ribosomal subunit protein uS10 domain-containing protein n=1 Tax=Adineta ricciae TaxID=249248 RepID=A0A813PSP5_ADIRI|nr:unnamed protein product [Adineta ricciae]